MYVYIKFISLSKCASGSLSGLPDNSRLKYGNFIAMGTCTTDYRGIERTSGAMGCGENHG